MFYTYTHASTVTGTRIISLYFSNKSLTWIKLFSPSMHFLINKKYPPIYTLHLWVKYDILYMRPYFCSVLFSCCPLITI